ncbi:unnamed protein product [Cladocopium goreaui]|uniref:Thiol S-methyltransferase TMT1B (Methyltransferase-like protein 7B) (Thiol S-methyltransferase METTL7B) n=1 Tax=Cladocopium goreaui TaxID=2562237 RepID=A0A9P1GMA5_9DINO|nr:unnamed protein product [Cladocopium goreaui]
MVFVSGRSGSSRVHKAEWQNATVFAPVLAAIMRSLKQLRAFVASLALLLSWDLALVPRRVALRGVGCGCWGCLSNAWAEVEVKQELPLSRGRQDADFAKGMAFGMIDYERAIAKKKRKLFQDLFGLLPKSGPVVLEVGIGSFPNALYLGSREAPQNMDIIGVDPNEYMKQYALDNAQKAGILNSERQNSLRLVRGIAESLPVGDQVADAVICTLTLCSVKNPSKALAEIQRTLKPGGHYLFVEHVLSETNPFFATAQRLATPEHVQAADGCHFDRRTLETIQGAGFAAVDGDYFELENCGATLHHAWEMWQATVIGCLSSMIVNEILRPVQPNVLREALMCAAFLATVFFLCSRPWALVQKRVSVGVMLCGTINMSVSQHAKPWWFPWTIGVPCTVGVVCAVIAMLLPPWLASKELHQRLAFQALSQRQILVEQFTAFFAKSKTHHAAAAHLLETFRDNQLKMKSLLGPAALELVCDKDAWSRLNMTIKFFDAQLSALRRIQLTTSSVTQGLMTLSHIKFRQSTEDAWRGSMKGVASVVDDLVAAELSGSGSRISEDVLEHLKETQKRLDREIFKARSEIMYHTGSQFVESEQQLNHHLAHVNRMACYFAINELISVTVSQAQDAMLHKPRKTAGGLGMPWKCLSWFQLPCRARSQDALKKVISLGLLSIGAWIPEWRAKRPEFIWAFIAASFIFSDLQGSSISTGMGRVMGTVFGGMVGFITLELFQLIDWPSKALEIAAYILVCVLWTFGCSLSRSSPRHGYTATVAGFSIYIMVVGTLESFGRKSSSEVVFQRMQEQFAGAVIYITVEMLLWRKSARTIVDEQQITILTAIKDSIVEATEPHLLIASDEAHESEAALLGKSQDGLSGETWCPDCPGSAFVTENSGLPMERNWKSTTQEPFKPFKSFKSHEKRESHNRMEEIYRVGNHALEAAKQGLVAATFEPTWWHKPFPMAPSAASS